MTYKPYYTSQDLINAVKRKIMFPMAQSTFTEADVLAFANEEMQISQVPSILQFHEEYFVYAKVFPLVPNTSRYAVPNRAIGMRLRDVSFSDQMGNVFDMARINSDDKAFFQQSTGTTQAIHKYYLEGNDVVLTPSITAIPPTGNINFYFYLRPNQLVANTRAAIIQNFAKEIVVNASDLTSDVDNLTVSYAINSQNPQEFVITPTIRAITSNSVDTSTVITGDPHGQDFGSTFTVYISEVSGSTPTINGNYTATALSPTTFSIPVNVTVGGTGGFYALENEFSIGSTNIQTASNLANTITEYAGITAANSNSSTVTLIYSDITLEAVASVANADALEIDQEHISIDFDQLPNTWTDPQTNVIDDLYESGVQVDFLQTNPGHRTYTFDVELVTASGTRGTFNKDSLKYYASTGTGQILVYLPIIVGDYICLANECIIPQIPPDLHTGLAERTAARILAAIGDQVGLDRANTKIAEIEQRQGTLLDQRVDGSPQKVVGRRNLLRSFKRFRGGY
jgi:hypothetical protein